MTLAEAKDFLASADIYVDQPGLVFRFDGCPNCCEPQDMSEVVSFLVDRDVFGLCRVA